MNYYQSSSYLSFIRPPVKIINHFVTGQTQIQRISKRISYQDFEYSLKHSKMLHNFLQNHPIQANQYSQAQIRQIFKIKNISNQQNQFLVRKILKEYQSYLYAVKHLEKLKKIKYDKLSDDHEQKLNQIWKNLMPNIKLQNRISNQWIQIGFQANDPATDFRGAGYLGLQNLHSFTNNKKCKSIFQWAITKQTEYFFCSASLFFTMLAFDLLKLKKIPLRFWVVQYETIQDKDQQIQNRFQLVFDMIFLQFDLYWKTCKDKSLLQFNTNLLSFGQKMKNLTQQKIRQLILYWIEV